ncbi:sialoadhesin-like isoform X2 [Dicentrarchus labrax]|uniref:sialoadhesin-like isoform X2 n=1 Tax=Dicentrarchus labrax TaxID=13489 RepID=UPI0021F69772|nr:sialoadhesin-like isoform X2 [Dicentrarchus labrax]
MEITALCIRLLIKVPVLLLPAQIQPIFSHKADSSFPHIVPSRLQFFEYESFFLNCEGLFNDLSEWRVMKNIKGTDTICNNNLEAKIPCNITTSFSADSGTYWCEAEGKKSSTVSILVTAGPVILESPAPVMEGEAVTLRCRNKEKSNLEAGFYKDGVFIRNSSGEMSIDSVSRSDEGLYRCKFFGVGESAESWLAVRAAPVILESPALPVMEGDPVTLRCRKKSSNLTADFYKDGFLIGNSSTGEMIIHNVSKSDEGLYKCRISGAGESAENRLAVKAYYEETLPERHSLPVFLLLWTVVPLLLVAFLLLGVGLFYMKHRGTSTSQSSFPTSSRLQTESSEAGSQQATYAVVTMSRGAKETNVAGSQQATYAVITVPRKANETNVAESQQATYAAVTKPRKVKDKNEPLTSPVYHTLSMVH